MQELKWWESGVVYQIYPRSFCDSNGDGIGDINGIISKLDYLKELGITIIWLSPVYKSPNDDNGYDISDYSGINPEYGNMTDMDNLIARAKDLGIKIIMDLVINHTSDEHKWFMEAKDPASPFRDYYIWRKGRGKNGVKPPNNWTSFFAEGAWKREADEYYLHLFSKKQPDLNWKNPKVFEEIKNIMRFWLDKGIAGFRCDVINVIYKRSLQNGKKHLALTGKEFYLSQEGCHDILRRLKKEVLSDYDCFTVGETVLVNTAMANDLCGKDRQELDMVFGFEHMETDQIGNKWFKTKFKPQKFKKVICRWQKDLYWNANYLENHDQPRSVSRFGDDGKYWDKSAKMLALLNICLRGTPYIYEGQEIGMTNGDFTGLDEIMDIESHNVDKMAKKMLFTRKARWKLIKKTSRDNARTPMQWKNTVNGGFTSGKPWLQVNKNYKTINVESAINEGNSIYHWYKNLLEIRKQSSVLLTGKFIPQKSKKNVFYYERVLVDERYIIICNMSKATVKISQVSGVLVLNNYENFDNQILQPYEARLIKA